MENYVVPFLVLLVLLVAGIAFALGCALGFACRAAYSRNASPATPDGPTAIQALHEPLLPAEPPQPSAPPPHTAEGETPSGLRLRRVPCGRAQLLIQVRGVAVQSMHMYARWRTHPRYMPSGPEADRVTVGDTYASHRP